MYYSHSCSYCLKVFYTYNGDKEAAATILYTGIKKHLVEYGEDHKEYLFDEDPETEINQMYYAMLEHQEDPQGDYEL
jgi:hypothetical protein